MDYYCTLFWPAYLTFRSSVPGTDIFERGDSPDGSGSETSQESLEECSGDGTGQAEDNLAGATAEVSF